MKSKPADRGERAHKLFTKEFWEKELGESNTEVEEMFKGRKGPPNHTVVFQEQDLLKQLEEQLIG